MRISELTTPRTNLFEDLSKEELEQLLVRAYGASYHKPLAKDIGVHYVTVYRLFNSDEVNRVYRLAISKAVQERINRLATV